MFNQNFHTHTYYCDGSSAPEAYVLAALDAGLEAIGFSGHAPVPFENSFAIRDFKSLGAYVGEIRRLKEKYKGLIRVFLALEADYIPGITYGFDRFKQDFRLDYLIGSVHLVKGADEKRWFIDGPERSIWQQGLEDYFNGNIKAAVGAYYQQLNEMLASQRPDVLGHLDKIKMHNGGEYFREDDAWYKGLVMESLEMAKISSTIVEVNTRGLYKKRSDALFPGPWILKEMKKMHIPVTISSDAHKPEEVSLMLEETAQFLFEIGYREVYVFTEKGWRAIPLS